MTAKSCLPVCAFAGLRVQRANAPTRQRANGFTLVELIVVSALLMIVGGGLLTTFITGQTSYLSADAYVQVQQEARRAFDNVVRELREAGPANGAGPPDPDINAVTGSNGSSQLNFQIARGYDTINGDTECQGTGAICWGNDTATSVPGGVEQWVHYATLNPNSGNMAQLIRWQDTAQNPGVPGTCAAPTCRVLANHVDGTDTSFSYNAGTKVVTINLKIVYSSPLLPSGSQATPKLTSQVKLRN